MTRSRFLGLGKKRRNSFDVNFFRQISTYFVVFSFVSWFECLKAVDEEFSKQNKIQSQLAATALKKKNKILTDQLEELRLQQASAGAFNISVSDITKTLVEPVIGALEDEGALHSPVKTTNQTFNAEITPKKANLRQAIQAIVIDIDTAGKEPAEVVQNVQAEFLRKLFFIFEQYIERKRNSVTRDKENLSLVARNSSSSVTIEVDEKSLLRAFELAATGVLHPNLAQLLRDCQLQVVLPPVRQGPIASMTPMSISNDYIGKIRNALTDRQSSLFKITDEADLSTKSDAMLIAMVEEHMHKAIISAKIPMDVSITTIDKLEELKSTLYISTCIAFGRYITGHGNRVGMEAILSDMNPRTINDLKNGIAEIFYSQNPLSSFKITRTEIHFGANAKREVSSRGLLDVAGWNVPVVSSVVDTSMDVLGFVFGNCLAPATSRRNLLTNSDNHSARSSSTATIEGAKIEEI